MEADKEGSPREDIPMRIPIKGGSLELSAGTIKIDKTHSQEIPYNDLIGFTCEQVGPAEFKLQLNCFFKTKRFLRAVRREISQMAQIIQAPNDIVQRMKAELLRRITNRPASASRRLLIYYNPHAGSNSKSHLKTVVKFISLTNFTYELVETTHRGHCRQHLATIDPQTYAAAVIISGDGLMHQFVNSAAVTRLPVTHVPAGSGNAFAKTQATMAGEDCTDQIAIFLAVKGRTTNMNLLKMELEKEPQPIYSFLSLQWAFMADIDMNSQFLRFIGGLRFEVYSAYRCLALKRYRGKLTYSQTETALPPLNQPINNQDFVTIESNFLNSLFCSIPFISDKYEFAPLLKVEDRAVDLQFSLQEQGRMELVKYLLAAEKGDHFDRTKGTKRQDFNFGHAKAKCYRLQPLGDGQNRGIFGIDGECYEAQRMQASLSDKRIITFI